MKRYILLSICCIWITTVYAQQGSVNLAKDINKPNTVLPKSNTTYLKEARPAMPVPKSLTEQYRPDAASNSSEGRSVIQTTVQPGTMPSQPTMGNSTTRSYNMNNGLKTTNTIQYDDAGKIRSSGSSIKIGK